MSAWDLTSSPADAPEAPEEGRHETIELVGPHLRVSGQIALGRFARLSDLLNHSRGYLRITDARLLRRNGEPTDLVVPELLVNRDEIAFVGQPAEELSEPVADADDQDRPTPIDAASVSLKVQKAARRFVIFASGHTITGTVQLHADMELHQFLEATEPRFVPLLEVRAYSLADRRLFSRFAFILVNRTQLTAASLVERAGVDEVGAVPD